MDLVMNIASLIIGFIFLVKGADFFVSSASSIAKKAKISSLVIGLTIVAFGTSLPELAVSFISSLTVAQGETADIALGNVIGSNIVNITLILGFTAITKAIRVSKNMHKKEFPYLILSNLLIVVFVMFFQADNQIVWWEASILLVAFIGYLLLMLKSSDADFVEEEYKVISTKRAVIFLLIGVVGVSVGGWLVTEAAKEIATVLLVDVFGLVQTKAITLVGLTVVAVGTSLPELVTSVVAARKGENEIAFGNLIGSNIFNVLFILGASGIVTTLGVNSDVLIDVFIMLGITLLVVGFSYTARKISKIEGLILIAFYGIYVIYIILRAFGTL